MKYKSEDVSDTNRVAEKLAKSIKGNEILCLYGDLGAGKTTFTKMLAKSLGFEDEITSPTFIIRADHENNGMFLYHFDWYRLDDPEDLERVDFYDVLGHGVVIIEWADKFNHIIDSLKSASLGSKFSNQGEIIKIYFKHVQLESYGSRSNNVREIEVEYGNLNN